MRDLAGKVAVVTGAASGIGLALTERLAAENMMVVLADVEEGPLAAAETRLRAQGANVIAVPTDVSSAEQVDALAQATIDHFGAVHVVCNNAGVGGGGRTWEAPLATWEWVLGVNLWGVIHGIRSFVPRLVEQREGHVVNTASMAGLAAWSGIGPYCASKFAVVSMSETLRAELTGTGVGVSVLCPGYVATRIADSQRNRPATAGPVLANPGNASDMERADMIRRLIAGGMAPADVAGIVTEAIQADRFWILTHPEMADGLIDRAAEITASGD